MPQIHSEQPVYSFICDKDRLEDFTNILVVANKTNVPLVVFKLPHRVEGKVTGYSYVFHATTFTAELLYPVKTPDITIETVETKICELAVVCIPNFCRSLFKEKDVSVLV